MRESKICFQRIIIRPSTSFTVSWKYSIAATRGSPILISVCHSVYPLYFEGSTDNDDLMTHPLCKRHTSSCRLFKDHNAQTDVAMWLVCKMWNSMFQLLREKRRVNAVSGAAAIHVITRQHVETRLWQHCLNWLKLFSQSEGNTLLVKGLGSSKQTLSAMALATAETP